MFLHVSVTLFTGGVGGMRGRGTCMLGGRGACMAAGIHGQGHAWWGACMQRCMHGRGQGGMHGRGACMVGGMHGRRDGRCSGWYASYWNALLYIQNFEHGAMWRVVTCPPGNRQTESQIDMTDDITFQQSGCQKETTVKIRWLSKWDAR